MGFLSHRKKDADVTVIIPIYNTKKYLKKCIESVVNQTYKNYEVLLIDDGSTDGSGEICNFYSKKYDNVRTIHKKNKGLVSARKEGVRNCETKYVYFVDSDDWIEKDTLEKLVKIAEENSADVVMGNTVLEYRNQKKYLKYAIRSGKYESKDEIDQFINLFLYCGKFFSFGAPVNICGKLYIRDKYLPFQEDVDNSIKMGEDVAVTVPYILSSKVIVFQAEDYFYHYRQLDTSMVYVRDNPNRGEETMRLFRFLDNILSKNISYYKRIRYYYFSMMIGLLKNESNIYKDRAKLVNRISAILNNDFYMNVIRNIDINTMGLKYKIFYYLVKNNKKLILALILKII